MRGSRPDRKTGNFITFTSIQLLLLVTVKSWMLRYCGFVTEEKCARKFDRENCALVPRLFNDTVSTAEVILHLIRQKYDHADTSKWER